LKKIVNGDEKMRQPRDPQLNLYHIMPRNKVAQELIAISSVLDENRDMLDLIYQDIIGLRKADTGRTGLSAEQVLRCAILKQYRHLTYEELAFHLEDSDSFRTFARLKMGQYPSDSTLQENIKAISPVTWEAVNRLLIQYAARQDAEKGRMIRLDSTAVDTNIHHPTDSTLLQDGIRVITRLLQEGKSLDPIPGYRIVDHNRAAKKRVLKILNAKKEKVRKEAYQELLSLATKVREYALEAMTCLGDFVGADLDHTITARILLEELEKILSLFMKVMDQAERRVMRSEQVPAAEKVVSLFECHTDVIVKGGRDTQYGHKIFLTGGSSGLILDCLIEQGNPSDAMIYPSLLERQIDLFHRPPRQVAADGGFASQDNLKIAKSKGVKDVMFAKKRGLRLLDMVKSLWVYRKLRNFRAGIEATISRLKRAFGLDRCNWSGWLGFRQYIWSAIVSYNVLVLGKLLTTTK
jgi:IS5 family transposase